MPATITDKAVLEKIQEIMTWRASCEAKYEALDTLWFSVANYHPDGMSAVVLRAVSRAQTKVLYPDWKGGDANH